MLGIRLLPTPSLHWPYIVSFALITPGLPLCLLPWPSCLLLLYLLPQLTAYLLALVLLPHIPWGQKGGQHPLCPTVLLSVPAFLHLCVKISPLRPTSSSQICLECPCCLFLPFLPQLPCFHAVKGTPWACCPPLVHRFHPRGSSSGLTPPPAILPPSPARLPLLTLMGDSARSCLHPPLPSPFQASFLCHLGFQGCPLTTSSASLLPMCSLSHPIY